MYRHIDGKFVCVATLDKCWNKNRLLRRGFRLGNMKRQAGTHVFIIYLAFRDTINVSLFQVGGRTRNGLIEISNVAE